MNRISGGWMTAVNKPDRRTSSTAVRQPMAYVVEKTRVSSLSTEPASKAKPIAVATTAIRTATNHGTPGKFGNAERWSAAAGLARCPDTDRPYRQLAVIRCQHAAACHSLSRRLLFPWV